MPSTDISAGLLAVTDETFEAGVLDQDGPVLVDFWAEWCPPCHMLAPVLAEIAHERAGTLAVREINADENPIVVATYKVLALPTLLLFQHGEPTMSLVGARPKARLLSELDAALRQ